MPFREERIYFTIASRRLLAVRRNLEQVSFSLDQILSEQVPALPRIDGCDGLKVRSLPAIRHQDLRASYPDMLIGARQRYHRRYIRMEGGFDSYFAHFSGKTRNTFRRKTRRFAEESGGQLDLREYRTPAELDEFLRLALPLSDRTYQQRLFRRGLRGDPESRAAITALAEQDRVRAFLLFSHGEPAAFLYLPVSGSTLVYAHLGYDPDLAAISPGTVLQLAALERLFAEDRFALFDFTEGDGAHKQLFGTEGVDCETFVMLHPTLKNRALLATHGGFGKAVSTGKALLTQLNAYPPRPMALR